MKSSDKTKIIYSSLSERYFAESKIKGFLQMAQVELPDGTLYPITFYDPASAQLEINMNLNGNFYNRYIAEPGLIIIPEVTKEYMENAVENLYEIGYFQHLKPATTRIEPFPEVFSLRTSIFEYAKAKGLTIKQFGGASGDTPIWYITLNNGRLMVGWRDLFITANQQGDIVEFETAYDTKRGGIIAVILGTDNSFEVIIPNDQIAKLEYTRWPGY